MAKKLLIKISSIYVLIIFTITLTVIPVHGKTENVIIGGEAFGVKLYCKGVMITKFESFYSESKAVCPAKKYGLRENDIITKVNGETVNTNEKLGEIIEKSDGKKIKIKFLRNNEENNIYVKPEKNQENKYCIGIWVRDSCAGIGTITYYNPQNNTYGALGHGICDIDSGGLMISDKVQIMKAEISGTTKSQPDSIGTLNGYFSDEIIADVGYNNNIGIYGKITDIPEKTSVETAKNSEIKTGKAYIITTVDGTTPEKFQIEITQICSYEENTNQNFTFNVTDKKLINLTGGIVQGMSGSPIIQNGKLIGAVTHVMVNNPTQGYGILIQNMLKCSDKIA